MNDIKLLIFDWDGTLMDSVMHIVDCMRNAIQQLGLESRQDEEMRNVIGLGMHEAIYMLYPEHNTRDFANKFTAAYRDYFFTENAPQRLFDGVVETLGQLDRQGYIMAIATGKSRRGLDKVLGETGIGSLFVESRCADETRSKPHPLMLQEILQTLDIAPQHAVMIGDTEYDMEMAKNAAVEALGVSYGVHEPQRLQKYQPLHIIDSINELPGLLDNQLALHRGT
jgi:phosphoglycolate phosphatase